MSIPKLIDPLTGKLIPPMRVAHSEIEFRQIQHARAQRFLQRLYTEREKLLQSAEVTQDNFEDKALEALQRDNTEMARAIMGKYFQPSEE